MTGAAMGPRACQIDPGRGEPLVRACPGDEPRSATGGRDRHGGEPGHRCGHRTAPRGRGRGGRARRPHRGPGRRRQRRVAGRDRDAIDGGWRRAHAIVADLADPAVDRGRRSSGRASALGEIDILVNNAAACFYLPLRPGERPALRGDVRGERPRAVGPEPRGPPGMVRRGRGSIVNISSGVAAHPRPAVLRVPRRARGDALRHEQGGTERSRAGSRPRCSPHGVRSTRSPPSPPWRRPGRGHGAGPRGPGPRRAGRADGGGRRSRSRPSTPTG